MRAEVHDTAAKATRAAADCLQELLCRSGVKTLMAAGGNSPLELYAEIARRKLPLSHLEVFTLDDYVGVPVEEPRTVSNLLRRAVVDAWAIPAARFHGLRSDEGAALESARRVEGELAGRGGLDVLILGVGRNGHLGYNEPGASEDSEGRVVPLEASSIEANRAWFGGEYAPSRGVTVGMRTLLAARHIVVLAFGSAKAEPVSAMMEGPRTARCPASWLQGHSDVRVFLDREAAAGLKK